MFKFLNFKDIEWKDAPRGYYFTNVKQHTLWEDKKTGATLALANRASERSTQARA
jgi:hypothetical protein